MEHFDKEQPGQPPAFAKGIKSPFVLAALRGNNFGLAFKYIGGTFITMGGYILGQIPLSIFILVVAMQKGVDSQAISNLASLRESGIDKNLVLFFSLLTFVIADLVLWAVVRLIHRRQFNTLITAYRRVDWKKIAIAFAIYFILTGLAEGAFYLLNPENYTLQFQWSKFIPLLLITLVVMPFQTSFEELFFRGYLFQGIGLLFKSTFPAVIITSLLFALMHSWNPEVSLFGFWVMFPFYFGFGLMLGFIVAKENSLEISLAVHAANNMFGSLFITFRGGAVETDAVFIQKQMDPVASMPYYFASMFLFLLICSFVFGWWRKKQKPAAET